MEVIDAVWFVLSVCFFLALCVHSFAAKADRFSQSQIYNLFQDLIRYGKTKTNLQRPAFLHAFDVPKRYRFPDWLIIDERSSDVKCIYRYTITCNCVQYYTFKLHPSHLIQKTSGYTVFIHVY